MWALYSGAPVGQSWPTDPRWWAHPHMAGSAHTPHRGNAREPPGRTAPFPGGRVPDPTPGRQVGCSPQTLWDG